MGLINLNFKGKASTLCRHHQNEKSFPLKFGNGVFIVILLGVIGILTIILITLFGIRKNTDKFPILKTGDGCGTTVFEIIWDLGYNIFMNPLLASLISVIIVSLISLIGIAFFLFSQQFVNKTLIWLVSFSAGSLMGGAFFHLIPETVDGGNDFLLISIYILTGFCLFFILERVLRWHHCHDADCETHKHLGHLNLIGDSIHNAIDGLVIISTFTVSPALGIPVTLSIIFHEIPQEIGDFGVLLYSGFKKTSALFYNFLTALTAVGGVLLGYFLLDRIANLNEFLLPFAAGGFIYIAASDLIPEIHQEKSTVRSVISFIIFFLALVFMLGLKFIGVE